MRRTRLMLAGVLLLLAVFAALLAADLLRWRDAIRAGDLRFRESPAAARWTAESLLPLDPARRILDVDGQLAFRRAARGFVLVQGAGSGVDNGASELQARGDVEGALADAARGSDRRLASQADDLLGVLAFADSRPSGANAPAPVERSVADFQEAVRLDPGNETAKFNLELLLQRLVPAGVRAGAGGSSGGPARGHRGAGSGGAGQGY